MRILKVVFLVAAATALAAALAGSAAGDQPRPVFGMAGKVSASAGFDKQHGPHSQVECTAASGGANTKLDCDDPFPNNEPQIVLVDETIVDSEHVVRPCDRGAAPQANPITRMCLPSR